jgi:hypothetical protein
MAWIAALAAVVLAGMVARGIVNFGTTLAPSMDAAYYPMQSMWLLERGRLAYHDAPLIFAIDAALAKLLMVTHGAGLNESAMMASRIVDCTLPPLVCIPIFALGYAWSRGRLATILPTAAGAIFATLGLSTLGMVGDFQKNSLALVWIGGLIWALWRAIDRSSSTHGGLRANVPSLARAWWPVGLFLGLLSCTHVGTLGAGVLLSGCIGGVALLTAGGWSWKRAALVAGGGSLAGVMLLGVVYLASPSRAAALVQAPMKLFGGDDRGRRGPLTPGGTDPQRGPRPDNARSGGDRNFPPDGPPDFGGGPGRDGGPPGGGGPGGGPGGGGPGGEFRGALTGLVYLISLAGIAAAWFMRRSWSLADRAVVVGVSLGACMLALPFISGEYARRLLLMTPVPVGIVLACVLVTLRLGSRGVIGTIGAVLAACLVLIPSVGSITRLGRPVVQEQTVAELEALRAMIPEPRTTLVSARHGLQWWAGYVLFTPVRDQNLPEDAFTKYSRVLMIEETGQGVGSGPPGGPSGGGRRDGGRSELRAGRRDGGGGPPGGMGGRGGRVSIPAGSKKIFEGQTLRVWELVAPIVGAPANRAGQNAPGA